MFSEDATSYPPGAAAVSGVPALHAFTVEYIKAGLTGAAGNPLESIVIPQQVRTVSKSRLMTRLGLLNNRDARREIEDRLLDHLGINLDSDE